MLHKGGSILYVFLSYPYSLSPSAALVWGKSNCVYLVSLYKWASVVYSLCKEHTHTNDQLSLQIQHDIMHVTKCTRNCICCLPYSFLLIFSSFSVLIISYCSTLVSLFIAISLDGINRTYTTPRIYSRGCTSVHFGWLIFSLCNATSFFPATFSSECFFSMCVCGAGLIKRAKVSV